MMQWYYAHPRTREQTGPCDEATVRAKYVSGELSGASLVWHEGLPEWIPARSAFGAVPLAASADAADAAELPDGLLGWLAFDGWVLVLLGLACLVPFLLGIGFFAAAAGVFRLRGILARPGTVRAESLPALYAVRSVARAVGWTWICTALLWAVWMLVGTWGALEAASGGDLLGAAARALHAGAP